MANESLLFDLGESRFGVEAVNVRQVLQAVAISKLPKKTVSFEGVFNLYGRVIPVVDLRQLLDIPPKSIELSDQLIVLEDEGHELAIRVDRAVGLVSIDPQSLEHEAFSFARTAVLRGINRTTEGLVHRIHAPSLFGLLDPLSSEGSLSRPTARGSE